MSDKARYFEFVRQYPQRFVNEPGGIEILLDPDLIAQAEHAVAEQLHRAGVACRMGRCRRGVSRSVFAHFA